MSGNNMTYLLERREKIITVILKICHNKVRFILGMYSITLFSSSLELTLQPRVGYKLRL